MGVLKIVRIRLASPQCFDCQAGCKREATTSRCYNLGMCVPFMCASLNLTQLQVDVMIESKAKELALLRLRDPTVSFAAEVLAAAVGDGGSED